MNKNLHKTLILILILIILISISYSCEKLNYIIIKNINIIPMNEEVVLKNYSILIKDGKIQDIKSPSNFENLISTNKETKIIDGTGKFLIPGLSDMQVHFYTHYKRDAKLFLANGVTLINNIGEQNSLNYHIKEKISKNSISPEVVTTSPILDGYRNPWLASLPVKTVTQAEKLLKLYKKQGYKYIAVYPNLNEIVYKKILKLSHQLDLKVVGYIPNKINTINIFEASSYKPHLIAGFDKIIKIQNQQDILKVLNLSNKNIIWHCPTLSNIYNHFNMKDYQKNPPESTKYVISIYSYDWIKKHQTSYSKSVEKSYEQRIKYILSIVDKKLIISGTGANNPFIVPGFSLHKEFEYLKKAGLSNYEILKTSTINAAHYLGYEDRLGTIEIGKEADLIILDKNPLENISNTKSIYAVINNGFFYNSKKLKSLLKSCINKNYVNYGPGSK